MYCRIVFFRQLRNLKSRLARTPDETLRRACRSRESYSQRESRFYSISKALLAKAPCVLKPSASQLDLQALANIVVDVQRSVILADRMNLGAS